VGFKKTKKPAPQWVQACFSANEKNSLYVVAGRLYFLATGKNTARQIWFAVCVRFFIKTSFPGQDHGQHLKMQTTTPVLNRN
jgi:hypothetical protein